MPTHKPRLNVTFGDEYTFSLVQRWSELSGASMGSVVSEFMDSARPILERLIAAAEAFSAADKETQQATIAALEAAEARISPAATRLQAEVLRAYDQAAGRG